jgi:glutamate--cysteine ligase
VNESDRPIESVDDLLGYFASAETEPSEWMVGTEHEKVGIYTDTRERITYEGDRGIAVLLERIAASDGWERVFEGENLVALLKDGASITLEPGGQIELSGAPLRTTRETCAEFNNHVDLVNGISQEIGVVWLGLGHDPIHRVEDIPRMPKARYDIMREYLPTRGSLALNMMHATATVQANLDYRDEADMADKMRTAMGCTSVVTALFANSAISEGKENGFATKRLAIWRDTDPDRCGILDFVFEPDFGYRDYIEWALDIPLFFIVREGHYTAGNGMTFRQFLERGSEAGERATLRDWDTHLTTLFPEVRLKRIIEVRGADAVSREMVCALPAVWKGILYSSQARGAVWDLVKGWSREEREAGQIAVARDGLSAEIAGQSVLVLARELVEISRRGLVSQVAEGLAAPGEEKFLEPLQRQVELGRSPGEELVRRWRDEWGGSMERLIESTHY